MVILRQGTRTSRLAFDDAGAAAQIAEELGSLRDAKAPLWKVIRESEAGEQWGAIADFLDTHSMIAEGRDRTTEYIAERVAQLEASVDSTAAAVLYGLDVEEQKLVSRHAMMLREELKATIGGRPFGARGDPFDAVCTPNFHLGLLGVELEYLRRASPLTLLACDAL